MTLHAKLPPSGAFRWGDPNGCPGAAAMEERYPEDTESEAAREGTAAHHYLSETLLGRQVNVGDVAPNGVPITSEMVIGARAMIQDVLRIHGTTRGELLIEQRLNMTSVHALCWGTADGVFIDLQGGHIIVWDYKFGHRYVDPYRC